MQLKILDRIFLIYFARFRRQLGEREAQTSWDRAIYRMSTFVIVALVVVILVCTFAWTILTGVGTTGDLKAAGRLLIIVGVILAIHWMKLRFRRHLGTPLPALVPIETREDHRLILAFQLSTIGLFVLACIAGYLLHAAGYRIV